MEREGEGRGGNSCPRFLLRAGISRSPSRRTLSPKPPASRFAESFTPLEDFSLLESTVSALSSLFSGAFRIGYDDRVPRAGVRTSLTSTAFLYASPVTSRVYR